MTALTQLYLEIQDEASSCRLDSNTVEPIVFLCFLYHFNSIQLGTLAQITFTPEVMLKMRFGLAFASLRRAGPISSSIRP